MANTQFVEDVIALTPRLTAFAIKLSGSVVRAQDLVQETLVRAIEHEAQFRPGTTLAAWLFTIMKNLVRSQYRKHKREVEDVDGVYAGTLISPSNQYDNVMLHDVSKAIGRLPDQNQHALFLIGALGLTYEEAARVMGCAVGTVKSRVNRAREYMRVYFEDQGELSKFVKYRKNARKRPYFHRIKEGLVSPTVSYPVRILGPQSGAWKTTQRMINEKAKSDALPAPSPKKASVPTADHLLIGGTRFTLSHTYQLPNGEMARVYAVVEA